MSGPTTVVVVGVVVGGCADAVANTHTLLEYGSSAVESHTLLGARAATRCWMLVSCGSGSLVWSAESAGTARHQRQRTYFVVL